MGSLYPRPSQKVSSLSSAVSNPLITGTTRNSVRARVFTSLGLAAGVGAYLAEEPDEGKNAAHKLAEEFHLESGFNQPGTNLLRGITAAVVGSFVKITP